MRKTRTWIRYGTFAMLAACGEGGGDGTADAQTPGATPPVGGDAAALPTPDAAALPTPDAAALPTPDAAALPTPDAAALPTPDAAAPPTPDAAAPPIPDAAAPPTPDAAAPPTPDAALPPTPDAAPPLAPLTGVWQVLPTGLDGPMHDVYARSANEVYIAGAHSLRMLDDTLETWQPRVPSAHLRAVHGDDDAVVVLEGESIIARYRDGAWTHRPSLGRGMALTSVELVSDPVYDDLTVGVGPFGVTSTQGFEGVSSLFFTLSCLLYQWYTPHCSFHGSWSPGREAPLETWLLGETDIVHTLLDVQTLFHQPPIEAHPGLAEAIHGLNVDTVTAVGAQGTTHRRTRAGWTDEQLPGAPDLHDVWMGAENDIWAVGDAGAAWHFDGRAWSPVPTGVDQALRGVWGADGVVWAVGDAGTVLRFADAARPLPAIDIQPVETGAGPAFVRFVLANDGAVQLMCTTDNVQIGPPLDGVGLDGGEIGYGYEELSPGPYVYWTYPFGFQGCLGVGQGSMVSLELGSGAVRTLIATGSLASPFQVIEDDPTPPARVTDARVRIHHASDDAADALAPALDFCAGGDVLAANLTFGDTGGSVDVPAGQLRFEVRAAVPGAPCSGALLRSGLGFLSPVETYTLILGEGPRNPNLPLSVHFRACADAAYGVPVPGEACVTLPVFPPFQ